MTFEQTALLLAWLAILVLALVVSGLVRQLRTLTVARHGPAALHGVRSPVGTTVAGLLDGTETALPTVALFVDAECRACHERLKELREILDARSGTDLRFVAVFRGDANGMPMGERLATIVGAASLFERLGVHATPYGVVVDRDAVVREARPIGSLDALRVMIGTAEEVALEPTH